MYPRIITKYSSSAIYLYLDRQAGAKSVEHSIWFGSYSATDPTVFWHSNR